MDSPARALPTDERLARVQKGEVDNDLFALYFQYGRYLLIASSRPGSMAANLQGKWNDSLTPAWGSKYTLNINTEMNYWPAETCNLSELTEPLFDLIDTAREDGRRVARSYYGARGFVLHHNTDLWGDGSSAETTLKIPLTFAPGPTGPTIARGAPALQPAGTEMLSLTPAQPTPSYS